MPGVVEPLVDRHDDAGRRIRHLAVVVEDAGDSRTGGILRLQVAHRRRHVPEHHGVELARGQQSEEDLGPVEEPAAGLDVGCKIDRHADFEDGLHLVGGPEIVGPGVRMEGDEPRPLATLTAEHAEDIRAIVSMQRRADGLLPALAVGQHEVAEQAPGIPQPADEQHAFARDRQDVFNRYTEIHVGTDEGAVQKLGHRPCEVAGIEQPLGLVRSGQLGKTAQQEAFKRRRVDRIGGTDRLDRQLSRMARSLCHRHRDCGRADLHDQCARRFGGEARQQQVGRLPIDKQRSPAGERRQRPV